MIKICNGTQPAHYSKSCSYRHVLLHTTFLTDSQSVSHPTLGGGGLRVQVQTHLLSGSVSDGRAKANDAWSKGGAELLLLSHPRCKHMQRCG
jgi:hypothetical protein